MRITVIPLLGFFVTLMALGWIPTTQAQDSGTGLHHINKACIGAKNKDDLGTAINMIMNNDKAGLAEMAEDGEIILLNPGTPCYLVHSADFFTNWQIRVSGQPGLWWVSVDNLDTHDKQ